MITYFELEKKLCKVAEDEGFTVHGSLYTALTKAGLPNTYVMKIKLTKPPTKSKDLRTLKE